LDLERQMSQQERAMIRVRGVYDGTHVRLLEPLMIPPDTEVEVVVPDREAALEEAFHQRLLDLGIIEPSDPAGDHGPDDEPFTPIPNPGEPISETIIRERR
jgi:hypothetical protein